MHITQDKRHALVGWKLGNCRLDPCAQLDPLCMLVGAFGLINERGGIFILHRQITEALGIPPMGRAHNIVAGIDDNAHEPAFEADTLKLMERAVGLDKAVLHGISGCACILQGPVGNAVGKSLILFNQRAEDGRVPREHTCDQIQIGRMRWVLYGDLRV